MTCCDPPFAFRHLRGGGQFSHPLAFPQASTLLIIRRVYPGSWYGLVGVTVYLSPPSPPLMALTLIRAMIQKA